MGRTMHKNPFRERVTVLSAVTGNNTVNLERQKTGRYRKYKWISFVNNDNTCNRLRIGISKNDNLFPLVEEVGLLAGELYWFDINWLISEEHYISIELTGITSGDTLEVYAHGTEGDY